MNIDCSHIVRKFHPFKDRALFDALRRGNVCGVGAWLRAGANPNAAFDFHRPVNTCLRQSCLVVAVEKSSAALVKMLIAAGAHVEPRTPGLMSPMTQWLMTVLWSSSLSSDQEEIGMALMGSGASVEKGLNLGGVRTLGDVMEGTGKLEIVNQLRLRAAAMSSSHALDNSTAVVALSRRRSRL